MIDSYDSKGLVTNYGDGGGGGGGLLVLKFEVVFTCPESMPNLIGPGPTWVWLGLGWAQMARIPGIPVWPLACKWGDI